MKKYLLIAALLFLPQLALAGSQSYTSPGTYAFTTPSYGTLTVRVWGAGGGGGMDGGGGGGAYKSATFQSSQLPSEVTVIVGPGGIESRNTSSTAGVCGGPGGTSSFGSYVVAFGGGGGGLGAGGGGGGQASAGETISCSQAVPDGGNGGAPSGGAGAVVGTYVNGAGNSTYGGGGGGDTYATSNYYKIEGVGGNSVYGGGGGGSGASPEYGTVTTYGIGGNSTYGGRGGSADATFAHGSGGAYGAGGDGSTNMGEPSDIGRYIIGFVPWIGLPQNGSNGAVIISWTAPATPPPSSCTDAPLLCNKKCPDGSQAVNGICDPGTGGNGQCSVGQVLIAGQCVLQCPAGDLYQNGACVAACSQGYELEEGECVFTECPQYYTQEEDGSGNPECTLTSCPPDETLEDGVCRDTGGTQQGGAQVPAPDIVSWSVKPTLVQSGETTAVSWSAQNVASCTVQGSNRDGTANSGDQADPGAWTSLTGAKTSSPIAGQTVYTILCIGEQGASPASVTQSTTVNIVPGFHEE